MNVKSSILILFSILCLFTLISTVCAVDDNLTQSGVENNGLLAMDSSLDKNLSVDKSNDVLKLNENESVLKDGEGTFTDLQNEINAATGSFTLTRDYVFNDGDKVITVNKDNFVLYGASYTVDGAGKSRIFEITGDNVTLESLNIKNSYVSDDSLYEVGAVYWTGSNGRVTNCEFRNNKIEIVDSNPQGAAINWRGRNATIENSRFYYNSVLGSGDGGALFFARSVGNMLINECTFENNQAYQFGGAIFFKGVRSTIKQSNFMNNNAILGQGGAIYYQNTILNTGITISDCKFEDNTANTNGNNEAGAIFADTVNTTIYKCNFEGLNPIMLSTNGDDSNSFINVSSNTENKFVDNSHIIFNQGKLWLENNNFKTKVYNTGLILSHVTAEVRDPSSHKTDDYYTWNAPDKFLYRVYILDDKKNEIVNREIDILDTKEGILPANNNFTFLNYRYEFMWFVGIHNISVIANSSYFADMDNKTNVYRVSGSYAHLQYLNDHFTEAWDYNGCGYAVLESNIKYNETFDLSPDAVSVVRNPSLYDGVDISVSIQGKLWQQENKKKNRVTINGAGKARGFDLDGNNIFIRNLKFESCFGNDYGAVIRILPGSPRSLNLNIDDCIFESSSSFNSSRFGSLAVNTAVGPVYNDYGSGTFHGIHIYSSFANDISVTNCIFRGHGRSNSTYIDFYHGDNLKFINNTFNGYGEYNVPSVGAVVQGKHGNNLLFENNSFEMPDCGYGVILEAIDKLIIKNMSVTDIYDFSALTVYDCENIYIDNITINAEGIHGHYGPYPYYSYYTIPEPLVVIGLFSGDDSSGIDPSLKGPLLNLTILNSEFYNAWGTCLFLKSGGPSSHLDTYDHRIYANISNIYCHDNRRISSKLPNVDFNFTVTDPDVYIPSYANVYLNGSRFENLWDGVSVWAVGNLTVNNTIFKSNRGFFTSDEGNQPWKVGIIHQSETGEVDDFTKPWYGENGAALATSGYLQVYNSVFEDNYNPYMSEQVTEAPWYLGVVDVSTLNAGGGAISYRPYSKNGIWARPTLPGEGRYWEHINTIYQDDFGVDSKGWNGVVENCTFINNKAKNGGAISIQADGNITINNSRFIDNHAGWVEPGHSGQYRGSKMEACDYLNYDPYHAVEIDKSIGNLMSGYGGAIFVRTFGPEIDCSSGVIINNCTFDDNDAHDGGAAIGSHTYDENGGNRGYLLINDSSFSGNEIYKRDGYNFGFYREVIYACIRDTNITYNTLNNTNYTQMTISASNNVYVSNNTEIVNMTNRKFAKDNAVYSAVLVNGYTFFDKNEFNNTILFVENPAINHHSFASSVHITYMDGRDHYYDNENITNLKLWATIVDDNNNTLVTDSGFLFADNYRQIHLHNPIWTGEDGYSDWNLVNITNETCAWNYTHSYIIIPKYYNPDITPIYKYDNETFLRKAISEVPCQPDYDGPITRYHYQYWNWYTWYSGSTRWDSGLYDTIHDFVNFTQTKGRLITAIYSYTYLQHLIEDFNSTSAGNHTLYVRKNITFMPEFDVDPGTDYYGKINLTYGVYINNPDIWEIDGLSHSISGENQARLFNVTDWNNITFTDWIMKNGDTVNLTDKIGGGIYINNSTVQIKGVRFKNNNATLGGAIYLNQSNLTFEYCQVLVKFIDEWDQPYWDWVRVDSQFDSNRATMGGAIYSIDSNLSCIDFEDRPSLDVYFNNNNANWGGAIYLENSNLNASNFTAQFNNNFANISGGAIYVVNSTFFNHGNYNNWKFSDNFANVTGRILFVNNSNINCSSTLTLKDTKIIGNSSIYAIGNLTNIICKINFEREYGADVDVVAGDAIYAANINYLNVAGSVTRFVADYGGAVYVANISNVILDVTYEGFFSNYYAAIDGGVVYAANISNLTARIFSTDAYAERNGGITYLNNISNGIIRAYASSGNIADGFGGGIFVNNSNLKVVDSYISAGAHINGGGIYSENSNLTIYNSDIQSSALYYGGCIYATNSSVNVSNSGIGQLIFDIHQFGSTFIDYIPWGYGWDMYLSYAVSVLGGAGICVNNSDLSISYCHFNNTHSWANGSAIYSINSKNISILNSTFNYSVSVNNFPTSSVVEYYFIINRANLNKVLRDYHLGSGATNSSCGYGGALYIVNADNLLLDGCNFTNSYATYDGGAIYIKDVNNTIITGNSFDKNYAVNGGAIAIISCDNVLINGTNKFDAHTVTGYGGVIYSDHVGNLTIHGYEDKIINFTNNKAGYGGAIFINYTNLTVINALFDKNTAIDGGAVYINNTSKNPLFENIIANSNVATLNGGAIFTNNVGNVTIKGNRNKFKDNTAINGGTFFINASDTLFIYNALFEEGYAHNGGIIFINETTNTTIINSNFTNNTAKFNGGAIYVNQSENFTIENCEFTKNKAVYGGGIYLNDPNVNMINDTFKDNNATYGAAIFFNDPDGISIVKDSNFTENNATYGGAIYINQTDSLNITNSTFKENTATHGGAIYVNSSGVIIYNSTFENNKAKLASDIFVAGENTLINKSNFTKTNNNVSSIYWTGSNGMISNSTFKGFNHIYVNGTNVDIIKNKGICLNVNDTSIYSVYNNNGTIYLKENEFNNTIYNIKGTITSPTTVIVINNETYRITNDTFMLYSDITDDNNNTIVSSTLQLINVTGSRQTLHNTTFNSTRNYYYLTNISRGIHPIRARDVGLKDVTIKPGLLNTGSNVIFLNITKFNEGEIVTINATILANDFNVTDGYITFDINNKFFEVYISNKTGYIYSDGKMVGNVNITTNNTAILELYHVEPGTYNIIANYTGSFKSIGNGEDTFIVYKYKTNMTLNTTDIIVHQNATVNITIANATFNTTFANATGTVSIYIDNVYYGDVTFDGTNTTASLNITGLTAGLHYVLAVYSGDEYYEIATVTTTIFVSKLESPITIRNETAFVVSENATINITVGNNATGNITVVVNGIGYVLELDENSTARLNITNITNQVYNIRVLYNGSEYNLANTTNVTFIPVKKDSLVNVTATVMTYGNTSVITVEVPINQTGFVTITIPDLNINLTSKIVDGKAIFTINGKYDVGNYTINVTYLGDDVFKENINSTNLTVIPANITAFVIAQNGTVLDNLTFILTSTDDFKGNVNITINNKEYYNADVKLLISLLNDLCAGNYTAIVTFYGDDNYNNKTLDVNFTVSRVTPLIDVNVSDVTYPSNVTANITISNKANGTVEIVVDGKTFTGTVENGNVIVLLILQLQILSLVKMELV